MNVNKTVFLVFCLILFYKENEESMNFYNESYKDSE